MIRWIAFENSIQMFILLLLVCLIDIYLPIPHLNAFISYLPDCDAGCVSILVRSIMAETEFRVKCVQCKNGEVSSRCTEAFNVSMLFSLSFWPMIRSVLTLIMVFLFFFLHFVLPGWYHSVSFLVQDICSWFQRDLDVNSKGSKRDLDYLFISCFLFIFQSVNQNLNLKN